MTYQHLTYTGSHMSSGAKQPPAKPAERAEVFRTISGRPIERLYTGSDPGD